MQKNSAFLSFLALILMFMFSAENSFAATPKVGRKAASRFLANNRSEETRTKKNDDDDSSESTGRAAGGGSGDQLLMLGLGTYINSKSYAWQGSATQDNVGRANYGLTFLFDQWRSIDMNFRAEFSEYQLDKDNATKLSLLPLWTFPWAESRFPLYFGGGAGLGVFFRQIKEESTLSLDYQLVAGVRFLDLVNSFGFFFEMAMKNHLLLLSDGQLNGTAMNAGGVFTF